MHVVLHEPEIPPNTGAIARTCGATATPLHLIEPLGFRIDEHAVRRAGLDYWHLVDVTAHASFAAYQASLPAPRAFKTWAFSARATRSFFEAPIELGDHLLFGKESVGLPPDLEERYRDTLVGIPMFGNVRSLNLSNAVAIAVYDVYRRHGLLQNARLDAER